MATRQVACPRCGAPVDGEGPLCRDCALDDFDLLDVPEAVSLDVCNRCGSVKRETWQDLGDRSTADVAIDAVREAIGVHVDASDVAWAVETEAVDRNQLRVHVEFTGAAHGQRVEEAATVPVRLDRGTCSRCGRIAGDDHDAIVQVRAAGRSPTASERDRAVDIARAKIDDRIADGDRDAFVTEVNETGDGVDLKLSTPAIARAIADRIAEQCHGTVDRSRRLITESDGQAVYRSTIVVRLPRFRPGDVVVERTADGAEGSDGPPMLVERVDPPRGRRLDTGAEATVDPEQARRIGRAADATETVLVAVEDDHAVQVLDPESAEPTTIPRPAYLDPAADTVPVIKSRQGLHVVPRDVPGRDG